MVMWMKMVKLRPGYVSERWCYSVNETGKLGKKNSEFTLFEPTTFRLVLRMLYHWALRDSSQAWLQTIVECCSKFQILISSGVKCYFETPFSKIIHDFMSKWREKSFLTRKLFSSVRQETTLDNARRKKRIQKKDTYRHKWFKQIAKEKLEDLS